MLLLTSARNGDERAQAELVPLVYDELHAIAERLMRRESPGHTLQATALVNEAYLRLASGQSVDWRDELHFRAVAAGVMRRVLIDHGRARQARPDRGQGRAAFDTAVFGAARPAPPHALEDLLTALEAEDERAASVCTLRYFGGLTIDETARWLGVSTATVERDWRFARAWFRERLTESAEDAS